MAAVSVVKVCQSAKSLLLSCLHSKKRPQFGLKRTRKRVNAEENFVTLIVSEENSRANGVILHFEAENEAIIPSGCVIEK